VPTGSGADLIDYWREDAQKRVSFRLSQTLGLSRERYDDFIEKESRYIIGVDEVGCGPLAGPATVCAFLAKAQWSLVGVRDSKDVKREEQALLIPDITKTGIGHHIADLPNTFIDKHGMSQTLQLLYEECLEKLREKFPKEFAEALIVIDGKICARHIDHVSLPKADIIVPQVSAASILAKFHRDTWMIEVADKLYPQYSFNKHKGYGTPRHRHMIAKHGTCPLHRITFLKNQNAWRN
jgi:ribonuclease HII